MRQLSAGHFHVIAEIELNDVAKSQTLEPEPEVLPALRELELPWGRLSRARATKPMRLGAICLPE